ncbi:MAG: hypothetical protein EBV06_08750 [Planctomycetia bacterium]|nr:hypothetical protein [Planctomycetia bacterium]
MPRYIVRCGCGEVAQFKIAAVWSDGITQELKTYGLCCASCLCRQLQRARTRRAACRLSPGETLDEPAVFELSTGCRDTHLIRRPDLEPPAPELPS